jgi:hypothetical protein
LILTIIPKDLAGFISYVLTYFSFCGWCCNPKNRRRLHIQPDSSSISIQLQSTVRMNMSKSYWWNPAKLYRKKAPVKGEKRKQGARTNVRASKQPNKGGPQGGKGTTKNWTLHQFAWSKSTKRKGGKPYKTPNLEEPSHAITAHLDIEAVCTLYSAIDTFCLYTLMKESYSIAFDLLTNPITPT